MDKVQKPSDSECYKPSSKPFGVYLQIFNFSIVVFFLQDKNLVRRERDTIMADDADVFKPE
jgi:hypothetical protein